MTQKIDRRITAWKEDVAAFARWVAFYKKATTPWVKDSVRERLRGIQQRWPQYIKESEIPND